MSDWAGLVWLVVLLAANAFFVGAEFGFNRLFNNVVIQRQVGEQRFNSFD